MREPSLLCSILDDAAALGQVDKLQALSERWAARSMRQPMSGNARSIWAHAYGAAAYRALAVGQRLRGDVGRAVRNEAAAESHLRCIATYAVRGVRP